jgi:hypothetical protein
VEVPVVDQRAALLASAGASRPRRAPGRRPQLGRLSSPGDRGAEARVRRS